MSTPYPLSALLEWDGLLNSVWWLGYEQAIFGYPKTFQTFITKQVSGWCECNSKLLLWEETVINRCPQCRWENETLKHLTRCTNLGHLLQLHDSIETIMDVMNDANVTSKLADMIETYLINQGRQTMAECTKPTSTYLHLAISIDKLGWDCFVEGCIPIPLINVIKPMFRCYKPRGSVEIWGTKIIKGLIGLTHKQWLYRNNNIHYVSEGLTLRQHKELRTKIKIVMKTKRSALLGHHRHYMSTNFDKLGRRPTIACQVWVANIKMAISIAKVAKGNFCTQDTLQQLRIPIALPSNQQSPPVPISCVTTCTPPHQYHLLFVTPGSNACHTQLSKTPYSQPHTTHCSSTPSHHSTLFPIFLRCHKTSRHRSPRFFPIFYPTNAPQPYDKICTHLHRLHVCGVVTLSLDRKKDKTSSA
jgi:hypothetical protein